MLKSRKLQTQPFPPLKSTKQLRRSEWLGIPCVSSSKITRKVGRKLEGTVSANWSADLNRGLRVSRRMYFSFVVVRIVAVTRHLVQGNLAAGLVVGWG